VPRRSSGQVGFFEKLAELAVATCPPDISTRALLIVSRPRQALTSTTAGYAPGRDQERIYANRRSPRHGCVSWLPGSGFGDTNTRVKAQVATTANGQLSWSYRTTLKKQKSSVPSFRCKWCPNQIFTTASPPSPRPLPLRQRRRTRRAAAELAPSRGGVLFVATAACVPTMA
jgi:hypothetical protein